MQSTFSGSRQGTFDTSPGQLDNSGTIWKGNIELPIVDGPKEHSTGTEKLKIKSIVHGKNRTEQEKSDYTDSSASGDLQSRKPSQKVGDEKSPRYLDHNKLFPADADDQRSGSDKKAVNGLCVEDSSGQRSKINTASSESQEKIAPKRKDIPDSSWNQQPKRVPITHTNGSCLDVQLSVQKRTFEARDSKSDQSAGNLLVNEIDNGLNNADSYLSHRVKLNEQQNLHKFNNGVQKYSQRNVDTSERCSLGRLQQNQQTTHNHPQQQPEIQIETSEDTQPKPSHTDTVSSSIKTLTSSLAKSIQQELQRQQEKKSRSASGQNPNTSQTKPESTKKSLAYSHGPSQGSTEQVSQQAFLERTPQAQENSLLLPAHGSSSPLLQDHTLKRDVAYSKDSSRSFKDEGLNGRVSSPRREVVIGEKSSDQKSSRFGSVSGNFKSQLQPVPTMADKRGNGEALSKVTRERDQLLKHEKTYQQRILQLEEEVKSVVKQSQELSAENRRLQNKVDASESRAHGGTGPLEVRELIREKEDLVALVAKATGESQREKAESEELRSKLSQMETESKQKEVLHQENEALRASQAELQNRVEVMEKENKELHNRLKSSESTQQDKLVVVERDNKKLQADFSNLQTKNASLEKKTEKLEAENIQLAAQLEKKKIELEELLKAMRNETTAETQLKEANKKLDDSKKRIADCKKDLEEVTQRFEVLVKEADSTKNALKLKDSEIKALKESSDSKDIQIRELKAQVQDSKRNSKKLEDDNESSRQKVKARMQSLKNEIEDNLAVNRKLKQERTETSLEMERLNRELAAMSESLTQARHHIKKLESDRGSRDKLEEKMNAREKRESELEQQVRDLNARTEQLEEEVTKLQAEKEELLKDRNHDAARETAHRKLQDEVKKLRQMLVERNMEIAQRQSERKTLVLRVDNIERKQKDSDIKVQQLKGWVDTVHTYSLNPAASHQALQPPSPGVGLPPVPSSSVLQQAGRPGGRGKHKKGSHRQLQQSQNQLNRSWENLNQLSLEQNNSLRTTPSLPVVLESKSFQTAAHGPPGYCDMYRNKMKLLRERKW